MENEWPEGRGIFHNKDKTFLTWVNEEDQLRIISMQKGGNVPQVFARWAKGVNEVEKAINKKGKVYMYDDHLGQFSSCVSNVGTGLRASMHILLPKIIEQIGQDGLEKLCCPQLLNAAGVCRVPELRRRRLQRAGAASGRRDAASSVHAAV